MGYIIESSDGRVLRISDAGIILSGSDAFIYSDLKLARKVAEDVMGLASVHGATWKLNVKPEEVKWA